MLSGKALGQAAYEAWGRHGVPVFPCNDDKQPLGKWQHIAATEEQEIVALFERFGSKARLIGAVMGERSGLFAVDFDLYKGDSARNYLSVLMASGCLPETRVHRTKSGGLHYIYGVKEGAKYPRNSLPAPEVEIRGEGGYIIVPPSHGYEVETEGVVDAPDALLKRLAQSEAAFRELTISGLTEYIMEAKGFHEPLTSLAAKLHSRGDKPQDVMQALRDAMNSSVASDPKHERHARWQKIMSGADGELARINASAFRKFNPRRDQMDVQAVASQVQAVKSNRAVTLGGFFAPIPDKLGKGDFKVDNPTVDAVDLDVNEFPFERAYNAADVGDQANKVFLLYPLVMEGDVVILSAEPKAGKTLTAMTLCLHMAAGLPFGPTLTPMDKDGNNAKVPIIYFALEGQGAIRKRVKAWLLHHNAATGTKMTADDLWIYIVERPVNLTSTEAKQEIVDKLILAQAFFRKKGWGDLGMVVFDTLTKAMPGKDQNSVEDTSEVFSTIDMMRQSNIGAAVMFIHHNNRQSKSPRGSSNILAEPDTILSAEKMPPVMVDGEQVNCVKLGVYMARAIDDAQTYTLAMHNVEIGLNSQNIMESAPVLEVLPDYDAQPTIADDTLRKHAAKSREAFYSCLWETLSMAPNATLSFTQLAAKIKEDKHAAAFYSAHVNSNTKQGAKAAWEVLTAPDQLPASMTGMTFVVDDKGVCMHLDTSKLMHGVLS